MFKVGDKVSRAGGGDICGYKIITISNIDGNGNMWFEEIGGWLEVNTTYVELVEPSKKRFASWVSALETS